MTKTGKEKILESALNEFAEHGYEGARVDRVAKDAGINKALIYYHFSSKKELFIGTLNHLFEKVKTEPVAMPADLSIKQLMMLMMRQFILFLHHNPMFVKIMDQAMYMDKEIFSKVYEQNLFYETGMGLYRQGVAKGEIRQVAHPADYMVSLLGACYFFYSHRNGIQKFYDEGLSDSEIVKMRLTTMEDILDRVFFTT